MLDTSSISYLSDLKLDTSDGIMDVWWWCRWIGKHNVYKLEDFQRRTRSGRYVGRINCVFLATPIQLPLRAHNDVEETQIIAKESAHWMLWEHAPAVVCVTYHIDFDTMVN